MTDTTIENPNTLAPVADNAFGSIQRGQVVPQTPSEKDADPHSSKLDQILAAVREGRSADASAVIDSTKRTLPANKESEAVAPSVASEVPKVSTGNKALDIAVSAFVSATGTTEADITKAMEGAYEAGDAKYIDKEFLKQRFGDKADQAIALAEAVYEADTIAQQSLLSDVFSTAGGEEQFKACAEIFKAHSKPAMRSVVKSMLDSGNPEAVREAASLIAEFGKQSGAFVQRDGTRLGGTSGALPEQGLSMGEFTKARQELNPMSRSYRADLEKLITLRRMGKQLNK